MDFKRTDADAVPLGLREDAAHALSFCLDAVGIDAILLNKDVLHNVGALLSQFLVDGCTAFGRSISLDDSLGIGIVLHIRSEAFDVGVLRGIHHRLALAEAYNALQAVGSLDGLRR